MDGNKMILDGIEYDKYEVESVTLTLKTCKLIIRVIFIKGKQDVVKVKEFTFDTNCDVNINEYIKDLDKIINE